MTREQKVINKKERADRRYSKKRVELYEIEKARNSLFGRTLSFSEARRKVRHGQFPQMCDMGYADCELRGYCNGDC